MQGQAVSGQAAEPGQERRETRAWGSPWKMQCSNLRGPVFADDRNPARNPVNSNRESMAGNHQKRHLCLVSVGERENIVSCSKQRFFTITSLPSVWDRGEGRVGYAVVGTC